MQSTPDELDVAANMARIGAGWKGSPFFKNPNLAPEMDINGTSYPDTVLEKLQMQKTEMAPVQDSWNQRK